MPIWAGSLLLLSNLISFRNGGFFFNQSETSLDCTSTNPNTAASSSKHTDFRGTGSNGGVATSCGLVYGWLSVRSSRVAVFVWLSTSSGEIGVDRTSSTRGHYNITSALLTFQFRTRSLSPWPRGRGRGGGINSPHSVEITDLKTGLEGWCTCT